MRFTVPGGALAFLGVMLLGCVIAALAQSFAVDPVQAFGAFLVFVGAGSLGFGVLR